MGGSLGRSPVSSIGFSVKSLWVSVEFFNCKSGGKAMVFLVLLAGREPFSTGALSLLRNRLDIGESTCASIDFIQSTALATSSGCFLQH